MGRTVKSKTKSTKGARTQSAAASGGQVQSLSRAIAILNAVADSEDGITLTDVSHEVGLAPSTAHRLLTTLQHEHFVRFDQDRSVWHIGVQAFAVGNAFVRTRNLVTIARPHMRRLMEESGETVNLAVEDQGEAVFLSQVECRQMMRALVPAGARAAMHCSGIGKALLASMSEGRISEVLENHGLEQLTPRTITRARDLRSEMEQIRRRGYSIDDEEHAVGLRCVAAVIRNEHGDPVAGVSLSGPAARISQDRVPLLGQLVIRAADHITAEFGGV